MGNTRGNRYSKKHISLDPCSSCPEFWDFGMDDMVQDISAEIDYILNVRWDYDYVKYIGYSMGTTQLVMLLSERPEYNYKISEAYFLAPAIYFPITPFTGENIIPSTLVLQFDETLKGLGIYEFQGPEFFGANTIISSTGQLLCAFENTVMCSALGVASMMERDPDQINRTMIPIYLEHYASSISTRPYLHYAQLFEYRMELKKFDFGDKAENIKRYGYEEPPSYNLQNVQIPVAIFTAEHDLFHPPSGGKVLAQVLPNVIKYQDIPGFGNGLWKYAIDADKAFHYPLIDMMNSILLPTYLYEE